MKQIRHPLARLRFSLGKMGQKQMAQTLAVSTDLIQSIELRRARLTEKLALRIADLFWR